MMFRSSSRRPAALLPRALARVALAPLAASLLLAACGGGDTMDLASSKAENMATGSGVAAVGAPLAGASVSIRCAGGAPLSLVTDASGAFTFPVSGLQLPCAARVSGGSAGGVANTRTLHSVFAVFGRVNVTPLTELLVARLVEGEPAGYFDAFTTAGQASKVSSNGIKAAQTQLVQYLQNLGVSTSALSGDNIVTGAFLPVPSDPHDATLEALPVRLAANSLSFEQARTAVASLVLSGPCANASGFCWPVTSYKLLTENRVNEKGEPEAKFNEHDVDITINADGSWTKSVTLKADKVGKIRNFDLSRTVSFTSGYRDGQNGNCGYAISAGEQCYEAVGGSVVMVCGATSGDDFVLLPSATVQKDSADEIKKESPSGLYGLTFDRLVGCAKTATTFRIDASGIATDETGASLGAISGNIGKNAAKTLERKFWKLTSGTQTRYVGVELGAKNGAPYFTVLVSR